MVFFFGSRRPKIPIPEPAKVGCVKVNIQRPASNFAVVSNGSWRPHYTIPSNHPTIPPVVFGWKIHGKPSKHHPSRCNSASCMVSVRRLKRENIGPMYQVRCLVMHQIEMVSKSSKKSLQPHPFSYEIGIAGWKWNFMSFWQFRRLIEIKILMITRRWLQNTPQLW